MEAAVGVAVVETMPQRFAVDGDETACQIRTDGADVDDEAFDEGLGIERGEDTAEGVVAGRAVGKLENAPQPSFLEFGETLARTSKRMGIQAETLQELRYAAAQAGMGHDAFDGAMQRFIVRAAEAQKGGGDASNTFKQLGVEIKDASGKLREPSALLAQAADGFGRITDQADRARLAQALFDDEGLRLVDVLAQGSQSLNEMKVEARALGVVMSKDSVIGKVAFNIYTRC